jgi:hypothetical protein
VVFLQTKKIAQDACRKDRERKEREKREKREREEREKGKMEAEQIKYMLENGISEEDCKSCNKNLVGSIKPYAKHLIINSGDASRWISHIAETGIGISVCIYSILAIHPLCII